MPFEKINEIIKEITAAGPALPDNASQIHLMIERLDLFVKLYEQFLSEYCPMFNFLDEFSDNTTDYIRKCFDMFHETVFIIKENEGSSFSMTGEALSFSLRMLPLLVSYVYEFEDFFCGYSPEKSEERIEFIKCCFNLE